MSSPRTVFHEKDDINFEITYNAAVNNLEKEVGSIFNFSLPLGGLQAEQTILIKDISTKFGDSHGPELWKRVHFWIFNTLKMLPYSSEDKNIASAEEYRRWKLTAEQVVTIGTMYETKYCNDVVNVFMAIIKARGEEEVNLVKCFKETNDGIKIHSLVQTRFKNRIYTVNAGSEKNYWAIEGSLEGGPINGWIMWGKPVPDQWSLGLYDHTQEEQIITDARNILQTKASL